MKEIILKHDTEEVIKIDFDLLKQDFINEEEFH